MSKQFPQQSLEHLEPDFVSNTVCSLKELNALGRPQTDKELAERIDKFFDFCQRTGTRPGIESLCLALHISRTTLFRWNAGQDCSKERQELIMQAKSFIAAFMEQAMCQGKISPPSGIFLMKNWLNYKDTISFENATDQLVNNRPTQTAEEIAARHAHALTQRPEKPEL